VETEIHTFAYGLCLNKHDYFIHSLLAAGINIALRPTFALWTDCYVIWCIHKPIYVTEDTCRQIWIGGAVAVQD